MRACSVACNKCPSRRQFCQTQHGNIDCPIQWKAEEEEDFPTTKKNVSYEANRMRLQRGGVVPGTCPAPSVTRVLGVGGEMEVAPVPLWRSTVCDTYDSTTFNQVEWACCDNCPPASS